MEEEKEKGTYIERKKIRFDTSIMLGLRMIEAGGLSSGESVKVETVKGSGRIVIEQLKKEHER